MEKDMNGQTDRSMHRQINGQTDNEWTNEWMNEQANKKKYARWWEKTTSLPLGPMLKKYTRK